MYVLLLWVLEKIVVGHRVLKGGGVQGRNLGTGGKLREPSGVVGSLIGNLGLHIPLDLP